MISLYYIRCPRTNNVIYVGKTAYPLKYRLVQHLNGHSNKEKTKYIRQLLSEKLIPTIHLLEETNDKDLASKLERRYVQEFLHLKCPLFNVAYRRINKIRRDVKIVFDKKDEKLYFAILKNAIANKRTPGNEILVFLMKHYKQK